MKETPTMIKVTDLIYEYPDKRALHGVCVDISQGEICALVGPNGAGKTTLLRCLAALELPFSGTIHIDGTETHNDPRLIHRKVGYLSDFFGLYDELSIEQSLTYMAWCHKIDGNQIQETVDWAISKLGLTPHRKKKAGALSRGLRQRLAIAQSILHKPRVLLLDEPASGLDPDARSKLSGFLKSLKNSGMTIIVSSHILAELEDYCTSMLVIDNGHILDHVQLEDFQNDKTRTLFIELFTEDTKWLDLFEGDETIQNIRHTQNKSGLVIEADFSGSNEDLPALLKRLIDKKCPVGQYYLKAKTLQSAYKDLSSSKKPKDAIAKSHE